MLFPNRPTFILRELAPRIVKLRFTPMTRLVVSFLGADAQAADGEQANFIIHPRTRVSIDLSETLGTALLLKQL
jgi:hypothetical protein